MSRAQLVKLGGQPVWREGVVTDNGNAILDVHGLKLTDPAALEDAVNRIAGVVTVGLFAHRRADVLIVAGDGGVTRSQPRGGRDRGRGSAAQSGSLNLEAGADLDDPAGRQSVVVGDDLRVARHLHECPAAQRRQIRALARKQLLAAQEVGRCAPVRRARRELPPRAGSP